MKTIEDEIQTNVANEIYTYIAIPINSLKQSNDIIQSVQPIDIASNVIYNVLPHDVSSEKIQTYTLTDDFIETLRENNKEHNFVENQESLRPTVIEQISNTRKSVILPTSLNEDKSPTFKCVSCNEVFKTRLQYHKHLEIHKEKPYKCYECSASYNYEINLKLHKIVHADDVTNCPVCEKSFNRKASLKNHLTFHEIEEIFTCTECLAEFDAEEEYNKHIQNHKNEAQLKLLPKSLICLVCEQQFEDRAKYKEHLLFHTEVKKLMKIRKRRKTCKAVKKAPSQSHLCDVCKKSFSKYCLLRRHMRTHTGEKPFSCHYCDRTFAQKGTLHMHLKIHTGLKPYQCTICSAKFNQKCNLRAHVQRTHLHAKISEKTYSCQLCACVFKRISSLNAHTTRSHRGDKETNDITDLMQQIDQLENQMNNKGNLPLNEIPRRNIIENDSEKFVKLADSSVEGPIQYFIVKQKKTAEGLWYACSYCEKEFKKPSDLIRHIRIHTTQKPFKCKHCNLRFALKSTLKNHINSHINLRTYECAICKKMFNSKRSLKQNIKTNDKNSTPKFVCTSCKPVVSDFKVKRANVEKSETLKALNNLNIDIELKQPMVETAEGLVPIISPKSKIHSDSANANKPRLHKCHCGAEFFQLKHLQRHMLIHTTEKKFKCYICTKCFRNSYALKEHLKSVHNGERKFLCRICDKRFVTNANLKRHLTTHSFVKPYICPYCKKRFRTVLHCRKHIKLHKRDVLINALTGADSNKFAANFLTEAALPENLFANALPDSTFNLGLHFDNLTDSAGISGVSNLLSETSDSVEQNKAESGTQILYTDKGSGVIVSTPLDISQTHDEKNKLEQQLFLTSTILPSYEESTKNITADNLENVDDSITTLPQENSTVFLNFDDLQLATSNLYSSYSNLKNFDQLLGEISEIQDNNILLTNDSALSQLTDSQLDTSNFDGLMPFGFNTNLSLNNVTLSTTNPFPNVILSNVDEDAPDLTQAPLPDLSYDVDKSKAEKLLETDEENPLLSNLLETSSSSEPIIPNTDETIFGNVDFTCSSCKKYLDNVEDLMHHYCSGKVAAEETPRESQNDGLPSYEESIQAKKKVKGHKCKKCKKTFNTKLSLQAHAAFHKEKKDATTNICTYCERGFKKHSDLLRHIRTHTGEKPFTCDKCQKKFTLKSTLETHQRTHNPESHQKYDCGVCGTHVSSKASLRVHMMMHTGVKPYQCSVCFENFRTSGHRRSHMRSHLNNNKDNKRSKSAKVTSMLQSVITETQNSEEMYEEVLLLNNSQPLQENKELTLQDSEVLFPNQTVQVDSLILQQLQQSCVLLDDGNERIPPFIQVDINNYGEITNVKSIRDIQESFKSTEPDKSTDNVYVTKKPSLERNFECDICHKKYTTKSVLTKHKRIHNKLNCSKCNLKFIQPEELQEHLKIHNIIRPFVCSLCDNSFSLKKNLLTHMKRIHSASFP